MTDPQKTPAKKKRGPKRSGVPWRETVSIPGPLVQAVKAMVREYRKAKTSGIKADENRNE